MINKKRGFLKKENKGCLMKIQTIKLDFKNFLCGIAGGIEKSHVSGTEKGKFERKPRGCLS